jgi:uncharacterized membrane protein
MDQISLILVQLVQQYPFLLTVIIVMGTLRAVLKPLFAAAHYYVEQTADPEDDKKLQAIEANKVVQGLFFVLDWIASVKIKTP